MTNKTEVKFLDIKFTANGAAFVFLAGNPYEKKACFSLLLTILEKVCNELR